MDLKSNVDEFCLTKFYVKAIYGARGQVCTCWKTSDLRCIRELSTFAMAPPSDAPPATEPS
eukprot:1277868-Pleurochrysis_carterae.AAC.1